jgi:hypothetical protein
VCDEQRQKLLEDLFNLLVEFVMSISPDQLAKIQADVDALKAAVATDTAAQAAVATDTAAVAAANTQLTADTTNQTTTTGPAVTAAEQALLADVQALAT